MLPCVVAKKQGVLQQTGRRHMYGPLHKPHRKRLQKDFKTRYPNQISPSGKLGSTPPKFVGEGAFRGVSPIPGPETRRRLPKTFETQVVFVIGSNYTEEPFLRSSQNTIFVFPARVQEGPSQKFAQKHCIVSGGIGSFVFACFQTTFFSCGNVARCCIGTFSRHAFWLPDHLPSWRSGRAQN